MPKRKPSQRRHPEKTPQQPRDRLAEIRAEIQDVQQQIETKRRDGRVIRTAEDFKSLECAIAALTNRLSALLMAEATQVALDDSANRRQARSLAQGAGHAIKDQGRRDVTLRTTCGQVIVRATYFSRNCDRSKASKGMYPMLLLWGVHDRCTAAIVSEISKLVAMLSSLEEVEQVLSDRGRPLDYKTIRTIAYRFATRARAAQRVGALNWGETVAGRRVVVSTDGGRIRIRTTKRGPKTAKGRNRYRTDWREPKLLIIYVVDEKGQMDREFLAVIDGTLGGPDAIFKLMEFYLRELKITTADKILFVADGARWIWNRVGAAAAVGGQTGPGQRVGGLLYLTRPLVKHLELLKVERHQRLQLLGVRGRNAVEDFLDGGLKVGELRMVAAVEGTTFGELPQAFDQVQVGRVRGEEQQRDTQLTGQCLDRGVVLIAGVVQHQCDRSGQTQRGNLPQQFAHRLGVDDRGVSHGDQVARHRIPRPQDIEPLTSRSRTHEDPRERPQVTQEGPEHEMGRVDEEHVTFTGLGGGQDRLQFGLEKSGLVCNVLGQVFLAARGSHGPGKTSGPDP